MTAQEKIRFKNKLKQFCHSVIEQRISAAKTAIENAQQSANSEEKSSAGDKYETGRAMGHLEKDMYTRQLTEYVKELAGLDAVNTHAIYTHATTGAFIQCSNASFFIAAGLGRQMIGDQPILFLSPHAPLAKLMQHKKSGDHFLFDQRDTIINDVY